MFKNIRHIHFIGIGGIGMSGIALILNSMGYKVSGSDIRNSNIIEYLKEQNIKVFLKHKRENIKDADIVVYSSAIKEDNVEYIQAKKQNIPIIPRAEMLAEIMRLKHSIAVSGTHGKTTTTSMIAKILQIANLDPTIIIGGIVKTLNKNAVLGNGKFIVAEADESDKSFLKLFPDMAVITNIDKEHLDNYNDIEDIKHNFKKFASSIPFNGSIIVCKDDSNAYNTIKDIDRRIITYGFNKDPNLKADNIILNPLSSEYDLYFNDNLLGHIHLNIPGKHNILNSLAAIGIAIEIGIDFKIIKQALNEFEGVKRRFDVIYSDSIKNIYIVDDYAHHPKEIESVLNSAKNMNMDNIVIIFQPHLYSRTLKLLDDFAIALNKAKQVFVIDIYGAREKPIKNVHSKMLVNKMNELGNKNAEYIKKEHLIEQLKKNIEKNTIFIFIGAGDIYKLSEQFKKEIMYDNKK